MQSARDSLFQFKHSLGYGDILVLHNNHGVKDI